MFRSLTLAGPSVAWRLTSSSFAVAFFLAFVFATSTSEGKDEKSEAQPEAPHFNWQDGPGEGKLGDLAEVQIPAGYRFLDASETVRLLQLLENPTSGHELGTLAPAEANWFVVFEFSSIGYVKDDDKDKLDSAAILKAVRAGTESGNERKRRRRGWPTMEIVGWEQEPNYDPVTHNLQWGIRGSSQGHFVVNYNTRLLGRGGVMEVTLVASPEHLAATLPSYRTLLAGFQYSTGNKYGEFRPGDKVAEYGLTALVAGGGLAAAAKMGLLSKLGVLLAKAWKLVVVAAVAIGAAIKKLFSGRSAQA